MRVLITRPAGDAQAAAAQLRGQGHDVLTSPLISIEKTPEQKLSLTATQAFIVTDGDGARALADTVGVRTFPVFCDSAGTAAELNRLGFQDARSADGDAPAIARLIERSLTPKLGGLVYACSTTAPINLSAMLGNMGFAARMSALYAVGRAEVLPRSIADALTSNALDAAVFFSAEEARAFAQLVQRADLDATTENLIAIVAAPVVAAPLTILKFARVISAPKSDAASVLAMVSDNLVRKPELPTVVPEPVVVLEPEPEATLQVIEPQVIEPVVVLPEPTPEPEPIPETEPVLETTPEPEVLVPEPRTSTPEPLLVEPQPPTPEPNAEIGSAPIQPPDLDVVLKKRNLLSALGSLFTRRAPALEQPPSNTELEETLENSERALAEATEAAPIDQLPPESVVEPATAIVEATPIPLDEPELPVDVAAPAAELIAPTETPTSATEPEPVVNIEPVPTEPTAIDGVAKKRNILSVLGSPFSRLVETSEKRIAIAEPLPIVAADPEPAAPDAVPAIEIEPEKVAEVTTTESGVADVVVPADTSVPLNVEPNLEYADEPRSQSAVPSRESLLDKARRYFTPRPRPMPESPTFIDETPVQDVSIEPVDRLLSPEPAPEPASERAAMLTAPVEIVPAIETSTDPDPTEIQVAPRGGEVAATVEEDATPPADEERPETPKIAMWSLLKALFARPEKVSSVQIEPGPPPEPPPGKEQDQTTAPLPEVNQQTQPEPAALEPEPIEIDVAPRGGEVTATVEEDATPPADEERPETPKIAMWSSLKALFARPEKVVSVPLEPEPSPEPPTGKEQDQPEPVAPEPEPVPLAELKPEPEPEPIPEPPIGEPLPETVTPEEKSPQKESHLSTIPNEASSASAAGPEAPPTMARTDTAQTAMKDNTPPPMTDASENNGRPTVDTETVRTARGGGRAARLLAEDAADARALNQRFKVQGGEPEPDPLDSPSATATSETMTSATLSDAAVTRTGRGLPRSVYLILAFIIIVVGVVVAEPRWVTQLRSTPNPSAPQEKPQTAAVASAPSREQLAALEARAESLAKEVAALNLRLAAVEQRAVTTQGSDAAALEQRLVALEAAAKTKSPDDLSTSVTNQARLLTNVSARIATLESGIGNIAKVEDLATRLAALEGKSAEANSVLALSERVGAIEKRDSVAATALVVAAAQLRDVARSGRPYAVELETVIQLAKRANTSFDVEPLAPAAAKGLPRADTLKVSFPDMAAAVARSSVVPADTANWFKRVLDRALSIMSIRPFGNVDGATPGAILARAEQALRADNLAGAVSELETLTGEPAKAATAWLAQAKAQVTAERALEELASRSVGAMSALTQTKPTALAP